MTRRRALRFGQALGWYWLLRGRGEGDTLAREILALAHRQATGC